MSVSKITELKSSSTKSFDDAFKEGIKRASKTLRHMSKAWLLDQYVVLGENGEIVEYRVHMKVTFILED